MDMDRRRAKRGEAQKLFQKIVKTKRHGNECILWPFGTRGGGRGCIDIDGKSEFVSRAMCAAVHGKPPTPDHEAAHSCGNGHLGCFNPKHLRWATRRDNALDALEHGTSSMFTPGASHPNAKLTQADVEKIKRAPTGHGTQIKLARLFCVDPGTIKSIRSGRTWAC